MTPLYYALVAYVRNAPLREFVETLRRELHPETAHLPAHITVLPPRTLQGAESQAVESVEEVCRSMEPFEVTMGDVETFTPITPTVFIRVTQAGYRLRELHDLMNRNSLYYDEPWPYMPHLTIAKLNDSPSALAALEITRARWAQYQGPRRILLDELTFVRQTANGANTWVDLAPVKLGRRLAPTL